MDRINAEVFVTIVKLGSLSRAADKLGYTKAGISYIVNNMEEIAGFKLFEREYGGVRLTPEGRELLPTFQAVYESELALLEHMDKVKGIETGHIRLISFNSVIVCWMPEILRTFKEKYPGIVIELSSCEGPEEGMRLIREGEADCGFLATNKPEGVELFHIKDEPDVAVVSLDHPMAGKDIITLADMPNYPFIGYSEDEAPFFYEYVRKHNIKLDQIMTVNNDYGNLSMIGQGMGFGVYPKMITENGNFPIKAIALEEPTFTPISLGIRSYEKGSLAARAFVDHVLNMKL